MLKRLFFAILCLAVTVMSAVEFPIKAGDWSGVVDSQGAVLKSLSFKGKRMTLEGNNSFEDFVMGDGGGKIELCEDFYKLSFEPLSARADTVVFTACGTGAYAGLRVTKSYVFDKQKPEFAVTWEYRNIGRKAVSAGLRTRCFFRNAEEKVCTYHYPKSGKMVAVDYPGSTLVDNWVLEPGLAILGIHGKVEPSGLVLFPPPELFGRLFCYFSQASNQNTQEFFINDQSIAPGESVHFTLKALGSSDVPSQLSKLKPESYASSASKGSRLRLPLIYTGKRDAVQVTYGASEAAESHLDLVPQRQLDESFRTLILPKGTDLTALSLYEMANGAVVPDRPVSFRLLKDEQGNDILKFRVPGINPGHGGGVEWRGDFAYEAWGRKAYMAPAQFACRLLFRKGGVLDETIPEGEGELIYNGDFSRPYPPMPELADGYRSPSLYHRNNKIFDLTYKKPGLRIKMHKDCTREYPAFTFPVRLERGVRYTFSARVGCSNPRSAWMLINLSFFSADGKALERTKNIPLFDSQKATPVTLFSKSFYPPEGAVRGDISFRLYDKEQVMDVASISLKPEPFLAEVRTPEQILRNELTTGYVKGLDLLEKLDFSRTTPHREFFRNPAQPLPKLLYLVGYHESMDWVKYAHRRHLIELSQRAKFDTIMIPLLQKIASSHGGSAWNFNYAKTLEPYSVLKLQNVKEPFDAVLLNEVDFSCVPQEVTELLKTYRAGGAPLFFLNCQKVPKELLGKSLPPPEDILGTLPQMRQISPKSLARNLSFHSDGKAVSVVWNTGKFEYWDVTCLPFVPEEKRDEMVPNYYGQDFPYWEYAYLAQLKILRSVTGKSGDVVVRKAAPGALAVWSKSDCQVTLSAIARDYYGRVICQARSQAELKAGDNSVAPPLLSGLSGGVSVVDVKVCNGKGQELDVCAYKVDIPALPLKVAMARQDRVFERGGTVGFTVESVPGAVYDCEIVDSEGRSVWRSSGSGTSYSAELSFPYTCLYNLYVRAEAGGKSALVQQEFSVARAALDPYDVTMAIWGNRPAYSRLIRDLGFGMNFSNFGLKHMSHGSIRAMVTDGCEPITFGSGGTLNRTQRVYRHNAVTDPVRNPCFSDPVRAKKVEEALVQTLDSLRARYYGMRCHIVADEADLGRSVCFSEHCLKAFRQWLQPRYASLEALNRVWGTAFKSWDEVVPVQYEELKDKERMAQYIEHKLFMNMVFARDWAGATLEGLRKGMPEAISGLSGTQNPGYSYDWVQMMKYNPFLMYYGGNQVNAVLDFAPEGSFHGQWLGYQRGFTHNEVMAKGRIWQDIFRGANLICKFSCETLLGDGTAAPNLRYFAEAGREVCSGAGARILHGKELCRDIGILYSQSSLLCAYANHIGSRNILDMWSSWPALLTDMGLRYRMISYEDLEERVPQFKVVLLSGAFSLSVRQLANLKTFVEKGGTLIADCGPGWYDGYGSRADTRDADRLFGIDRSQAKLYPADAPQLHKFPVGETGLKLDGGKAGQLVSGEPIAIARTYGKGRTLLLNLGIGSYQSVSLGGVGGEDLTVVSGEAEGQKALRALVAPLLACCKAPFAVEGVSGATVFLRQDGANYLAGILPELQEAPFYKDLKRQRVKLDFPVKGHLYLLRSGRYLGSGESCELELRPGDPELVSILPAKVRAVEIEAPATLERGAVCKFGVKVAGGLEKHVLRIEVRRPDGTLPFGYGWNSYQPCAGSSFAFQFALNDMPGTWKLVVRDVDSGVSETRELVLR